MVPEAADTVPAEAAAMYPTCVHRARHRAESLSTTGYDEAIESRRSGGALAEGGSGAQAIMVIGTSLTFYRGAAFNRR